MTNKDKQEIIAFIRNDTRTQSEIFNSIKQRIQRRSPTPMSDKEAIAATRRLLGFFDVFVDKPRADLSEKIDEFP